MNSLKRYFDGIILCGWIWFYKCDSVLTSEVNSKTRGGTICVFDYLTCVDGFVGFNCVLEIIMFEYDIGK